MIRNLVLRLAYPCDPGAFRLWLALVVVVHHVRRIEIGKAPVLVFFALSGFWVHKVWTSRYAHTRQPWLTFLISRWWRIAPVLMLATLLCVAAQIAMHDADLPLVRASTLQQAVASVSVLGYAQLPTRPVGPGWSLDIEMQFYCLAPLMVLAVRRWPAALVLVGGVLVFEASMLLQHSLVVTSFLPWFLAGMVAAEHGWSVPPRLARLSFALPLLVIAGLWFSPWRGTYLAQGAPENAGVNMVLALLILPFALSTLARQGDRTDAALADQSYLVYMLHWPAITVLRDWPWPSEAARLAGGLGLALAVTALSLAVWRWLDRPLNRARSRWVKRRLLVPAAAPATKGGDKPPAFA